MWKFIFASVNDNTAKCVTLSAKQLITGLSAKFNHDDHYMVDVHCDNHCKVHCNANVKTTMMVTDTL